MNEAAYRWLMQQSKPAHRWLFISITLGIFSGLLIIVQSGLLAFIIDRVYLHQATRTHLFSFLILFFSTTLLRSVTTFFREKNAFKTATMIKQSIRKNIFEALMQHSPSDLSALPTGGLTTALIEQIEALHHFYSDYFPQMLIAVILPFIILIFVWMQNWIAGIILLFAAPLIPLFMALIGRHVSTMTTHNFQVLSRMSTHFLEQLQGLATLILFRRAPAQLDSIEQISNEYRTNTMRVLRIAFLSSAALELFSTLSIALIAVYLGLGLLGIINIGFFGVHITLQHALFILLLAPEFFMPLRQLGSFYHARSEAMGAANELLKIVGMP